MESPAAAKLEGKIESFSQSTGIDKKNSMLILLSVTGVLLFFCGLSIALIIVWQYKKKLLDADVIHEKDKELKKQEIINDILQG